MKAFAELYAELDATTSSNAKLAAMQHYFANAAPEDAAWAVYFLSGGRPRQLVPVRILRELAVASSGLSPWLFEESYQAVGDLAETISLVLPEALHSSNDGLAVWIEDKLLPLRGEPPQVLAERLPALWSQLDRHSLMLCIKLITGSFRVGVSKLLVTRALAAMAGIDSKRVAQRLVGYTDLSNRPSAPGYLKLIAAESSDEHAQRGGQPYPFFLAHALSQPVEQFEALLGPAGHWQVEWKWDGIRAQVVKRDGRLWIWSRGEELVTERFPELDSLVHCLPDGTVIDGESSLGKPPPPPPRTPSTLLPLPHPQSNLSLCCNSGSAVKPWTKKFSTLCRWSSSPTTCWNGRAKTGAIRLRPRVALSWNRCSKPALTRCCCPRPCSLAKTGSTSPDNARPPAVSVSKA